MKQKKTLNQLILFGCLLLFAGVTAFGQNEVSGTVTSSEDNQLVIGANVIVKGTSKGTVTDFDGNYTINNISPADVLVFSYIGYKTVEITIGNQTTIDVALEEDSSKLDEVVVVGYGTSKKSDLTGAITSVSSKDFEKQPLSDVSQALQGRAAGVQVTQTGGGVGGDFKIRIRGANSITGNNDPLFVIDGQFAGLNSVNVNDIESMEVLKDASATAIYGTRGANGVVLITTKKGRKGKAKVNVELFSGVSVVTQKLDLLNGAEFAEGVNFSDGAEIFTQEEIEALRINGGEDWQELLFQTAYFNNVQVSASGGSDTMDYYLSGNYFDEESTIVGQDLKRLNLRANFNAELSEKVKIGLNFNVGHQKVTGTSANLGDGLSFDPTTFAFDENGDFNFISERNLATAALNPLIAAENRVAENTTDRININGNLNWDVAKNLVFNTSFGVEKAEIRQNNYSPLILGIGVANVDSDYTTNIFNTNRLTYSLDINENNRLKIDAVYELVFDQFNRTRIDANTFFTDLTTFKDLSVAANQVVSNSETNRDLESVLTRVNYSLFDKYLFTASIRGDGTSVFQNDKWGYFPSGSIAWKVSEEGFIKNSKTINNLKLRASYGQVGNQGVTTFGSRSSAEIGQNINFPFNGDFTTGVAPSERVANPDLTWETTEQFNAGVDLGLWNSAITLSLEYYKKNTTDLLLDTQLPSFVGPTNQFINAGEVENKGFDITIGTRIVQSDDWNINSTLSVSRNQNEVLSLNDGLEFLQVGGEIRGINPTRVEVGQPISTFRGFIFDGVYQLGQEAEAAAFGRVPGDAIYRDVSGPEGIPDGIITPDDFVTIGDGNPDFTWGWNWDINYKNWDLNFVFTGSHGNDIFNIQRSRLLALGAIQFHATSGEFRDRWTPTNPSNTIPSGRDGTELQSSQFIEDGSYVTLKNIALAYNFDSALLDKLGFSNAKIYGSVTNAFIITDYSGFDPEATASGGNVSGGTNNADTNIGIDFNTEPINRSFTFGLNVTF